MSNTFSSFPQVVRNRADALVLTGAAAAVLDLQCDRCLKPFQRELRVPVECLLAEELEDEHGV